MTVGQLVLTAALGASVAALAVGVLGRSDRLLRALSWLLLLFVGAAVFLLALQLVVGDFALRYVWQYSATYQPLNERLAALVAGAEGSLLVWLLLASAVAAWSVELQARGRWPDGNGGRLIQLMLVGIALVLGVATMISTPFQLLAEFAPAAAQSETVVAEGRGLNPVLANPWMVPHTVLTLAAFALVGLAAAVSLLQLVRAVQHRLADAAAWDVQRIAAARWAWLVLTLALFTGIVWAYEEMSFGWFWSWDPVESASLAVWLVLTAALHAPRGAAAVGGRALLGPAMTAIAFVTVLFASVIARSGLHPSVHAFAGGPAGAVLGGFLALVLPLVGVTFAYAWRRTTAGTSSTAHDGASLPAAAWAAVLLGVAAGLIAWGLAYPILASRVFGFLTDLDGQFFSLLGYVLAIGALLMLGASLTGGERRRRDRLALFGVFALLTVMAALVKPIDGLTLLPAGRDAEAGPLLAAIGAISVLSLLPAAVYAMLGITERLGSGRSRPSRSLSVLAAGHAALHAGVVVVLVGVTFSTLFATSTTVAVQPRDGIAAATAGRGELPANTRGVGVRMMAFTQTEQRNILDETVELRETASLEVLLNGTTIASGEATLSSYPQRDMGRHVRVLVDRGLLHDTQVIYHGLAEMNAAGIPVTVRRIPLTSLVWGGMALFVIGMLLVQIGAAVRPKDRPPARKVGGR